MLTFIHLGFHFYFFRYSPALKPLRQIALVLNFPPTTTSRLASRLNEVMTVVIENLIYVCSLLIYEFIMYLLYAIVKHNVSY